MLTVYNVDKYSAVFVYSSFTMFNHVDKYSAKIINNVILDDPFIAVNIHVHNPVSGVGYLLNTT